MSSKSKKPKLKPKTKPKKPPKKGFGTSSTEQENHVNLGPGMSPDLMGNEFMKTMLA